MLFGGFIGINAIPGAMEAEILGLSVAVIYGVGLALAAFVFAVCYAKIRRAPGQARRGKSD
jgi:hypothetical protein